MIKTKMYLHSEKDTNYGDGGELGLQDKALDSFKYALYEVEFDVEINEETGHATIVKLNGRDVERPTKDFTSD